MDYIINNEALLRLSAFLSVLVIIFIAEMFFPIYSRNVASYKRWIVNFSFVLILRLQQLPPICAHRHHRWPAGLLKCIFDLVLTSTYKPRISRLSNTDQRNTVLQTFKASSKLRITTTNNKLQIFRTNKIRIWTIGNYPANLKHKNSI